MKIDPWEESLRDAAVRLKNEAPEGLEQRISRAVADAARPEQPPALFRPAVIVFAVAACAAVAFYVSHRPAPGAAPEIALANPAAPTQADEALAPDATDLMQQDPLQDEADSVYSDARSAVSFLADNFLPSTPQTPG
jgi:hypothetical protein